MAYLLGLDVGTTGAKALLVDSKGGIVARASCEYPLHTPRLLWSEQNAEDWWNAVQWTSRKVLSDAGARPHDIAGIGLTGQMHGLVVLDSAGNVLRRCIMWNDQRTEEECKEMTELLGLKRMMEVTANPVLPGFTAPKILWVRRNEPQVYAKIARVMLPKDYIRFMLSGEFATDVSDASGTSLFDVGNRRWSSEILNSLDIPPDWMPVACESQNIAGTVNRDGAESCGLRQGTPLVAGAGDQAACGVGNGIVKAGIVSITLGTSGVVFTHTDQLTVERQGRLHTFCHAVPGKWHVMGVTLAAGGSFRWFRDTLGDSERAIARERGVDSYEILSEEAATVSSGSDGLLFLPYLSGERTPYPDPHARGVFFGLTTRHSRFHMIRAVLEGVAYSLRDCLEIMKREGLSVKEIRVSGGGARSALWRQILADVLDNELVTVVSAEGASYGAALLAGVGTGFFGTIEEACEKAIRVSARAEPNPTNVRVYDEYYSIYRQMYGLLKRPFDELTQVR